MYGAAAALRQLAGDLPGRSRTQPDRTRPQREPVRGAAGWPPRSPSVERRAAAAAAAAGEALQLLAPPARQNTAPGPGTLLDAGEIYRGPGSDDKELKPQTGTGGRGDEGP